MTRRPPPEIPPAGSVLDEMFKDDDEPTEADTGDTRGGGVSNTSPPHGGSESAPARTRVGHAEDNRSAGASRPAPAGMTRHTLYIARETADRLDAAAARLQEDLGGMVPKHRILAALITAGVGQADVVRTDLRAELLHNLGA